MTSPDSVSASRPSDADYAMVYTDLKRLARRQLSRESPLTDLSPTALVHESYQRMAGLAAPLPRESFFGYAARAMRSIIVDYVRKRQADKRDGIEVSLTLLDEQGGQTLDYTTILAVDRALEGLRDIDGRAHDLVELRYFCGFTLEECAEQLKISVATATRDWQKARVYLAAAIGEG